MIGEKTFSINQINNMIKTYEILEKLLLVKEMTILPVFY